MNTISSTKKVSFAKKATIIRPALVLAEEEAESLWYQDSEIFNIIADSKAKDDLPSFWYPLRLQRLKLLYTLINRAQVHQKARFNRKEMDCELLAKFSRSISAHSQVRARKQGLKDAETVGLCDENQPIGLQPTVVKRIDRRIDMLRYSEKRALDIHRTLCKSLRNPKKKVKHQQVVAPQA